MLTLSECLDDQSKVEEAKEENVELFEAGEDAAEALEAVEQSLNFVALTDEWRLIVLQEFLA